MSVELQNEMKKLYGAMQHHFYIINHFLDSLDFKSTILASVLVIDSFTSSIFIILIIYKC